MVQNNKVLTVSYGTFSCTLEGFEDSFGTMKAIAEYFRDLAADDRYFGAEPPQPDTEMLARIAEREISRQVEASRDSHGIVLRAAEAAPVAALAAEAREEAPEAEAPETEASVAEAAAAEAPKPEAALPEAPAAGSAIAADFVAADAEAQPEPPADDTVAELAPEIVDAEVPAPVLVAETGIVPAADSIAAKLDRIRAVVSENETESGDDGYTEDEHAEDMAESPLAEAVSDITASLDADDAADLGYEDSGDAAPVPLIAENEVQSAIGTLTGEEPDTVSDIEASDGEIADMNGSASEFFEDTHAPFAADEESGITGEEDVSQEPAPVNDAFAAEPSTGSIFSDDDEDDEDYEDEFENILSSEDEDGIEDKTDDSDDVSPADARVLKVGRDEFAAAQDAGGSAAGASGSLSEEDEAELMAELAAVEAELKADAADDEFEDDDDFDGESIFDLSDDSDAELQETDEANGTYEAADAIDREAETEDDQQSALPPAADEDASDLSRLMAEADEKFDNPDLSTNRDTYSHLRAAVAAAHAERSAGGTVGTRMTEDDDPYREDLASVVRPRRPVAQAETPRPRAQAEEDAPLKLVAEQRVDLPQAERPSGPVRPRRIQTEDGAPAGDTKGGFAAFAAEAGAVSLPDLLEAAAAYLSFVEGREQFSRPQLMNQVRQLDNQEFNREDGLRSFGQLLRDGKIEKTGGGRFTASEHIGFRPGERAAG